MFLFSLDSLAHTPLIANTSNTEEIKKEKSPRVKSKSTRHRKLNHKRIAELAKPKPKIQQESEKENLHKGMIFRQSDHKNTESPKSPNPSKTQNLDSFYRPQVCSIDESDHISRDSLKVTILHLTFFLSNFQLFAVHLISNLFIYFLLIYIL